MGKVFQRAATRAWPGLLCAAMLTISASAAHADPIQLTAPSALDLDFEGNGFFFVTPGFSAHQDVASQVGIFFVDPPPGCNICTVGQTFNPSFSTTNAFMGTGPATLGSQTFTNVTFFGDLAFTATPVAFPNGTANGVLVKTPFSFTGALRGFEGGQLAFSVQLVGSGTAQRGFDQLGANTFIGGENRLTYFFGAAEGAATPEPASLLLMLTGVGAGAIRRRRKSDG